MAKHGGKRNGAGRKPKADEIKLIERLSPLDDTAFKQLEQGLKSGDFRYLKLFYEYRIGKPRERVDHTTNGESINNVNVNILNQSKPVTSESDINEDI